MNEQNNAAKRLWTPEFLSMGGSNFLLFLVQYIMIAALPIYIMDSLGGGEMEAGLAMAAFQVGTVVARPMAGRLIDDIDKRKLFRLVAAVVALVLPQSRKGTGIGYFALSVNLAMVVGPMLGLLIIGAYGARSMFVFVTGCAVLTAGLMLWRHLPDAVMQPASQRQDQRIAWRDFIERRSVPAAFLGGCVFFAYGGVLTFLPLYARGLGMQQETSLFYAVFAAVIVVTRPMVGHRFDRMGPDATIWPGLAAFALGMMLLGHATGLFGLFAAAAVLGLGFGALSPAFQTLAVLSAPSDRSGVATATYFWSLDISVGLAALVLSPVVEVWGYPFLYGVILVAVIAATAACYALLRHRVARREI